MGRGRGRTTRIFAVACLLAAAFPLGASELAEGVYLWSTEIVDSTSTYTGPYNSLALDGQDRPHITYHDFSNADLRYARWDGSQWTRTTVDGVGAEMGWFTSIALDSADRPHVTYFDITNLDLRYAYWDGTQWIRMTVDSPGETGWHTRIALDSGNRPHIAYVEPSNWVVRYATWDGTQWIRETVVTNVNDGPAIVVDSSNVPHIAVDGFYLTRNAGVWTSVTVDTSVETGRTSAVLDAQGRPHLCHQRAPIFGGDRQVRYAHHDGSQWLVETVDSGTDVGQDCDIDVDSLGRPHIGYYRPGSLRHAVRGATGWSVGTVWTGPSYYLSLKVTSTDQPRLSFCECTSNAYRLRYASGAWVNQPPTATFAVSPGSGDVLTSFRVDASGVSDAEDPATALQVRWDWEDDGVWDTLWDPTKVVTHSYSTPGTHTIRLEVRDTGGATNSTTRTVTVDNSAPTLTSPSVFPALGNRTTEFTYGVTYEDVDGDAPTVAEVVIDGNAWSMVLVWGDPATGAVYNYLTALGPGLHNYYFRFSEARGGTARSPVAGVLDGPDVVAFSYDPASFSLSVGPTSFVTTADLSIWNSGSSTLTYTITPQAGWISANPVSGASSGETDIVTLTVDGSTLPEGTHSSSVRIDSSDGPALVPISLTVDRDERPVAMIATPTEGTTVSTPDVVVTGTASDDVGVQRIEVRANAGPWLAANGTTSWSIRVPLRAGLNRIDARAVDTADQPSEYATVNATYTPSVDREPPAILHTIPTDLSGPSVQIEATVTDPSGVASVVLRYRWGQTGAFDSKSMPLTSGSTYATTVAVPAEGGILEYYFEATDTPGNLGMNPAAGAGAPYRLTISPPTQPPSGTSLLQELWMPALAIILIAVIAGVAAAAVVRRRRRKGPGPRK